MKTLVLVRPDERRSRLLRASLAALLLLGALGIALVIDATVLALAASASPARAAASHSYTLPGDNVAVYNLAGRTRIEPGRGRDVVVEVTLAGRDAERLSVENGMINGRQTLRVIYPGSRVVYPELGWGSQSKTRVMSDGRFGEGSGLGDVIARELTGRSRTVTVAGSGSGLEAHADLRILLPAGQRLAAHVVAGEISVSHVEGRLSLDGGVGPVRVDGLSGTLSVDVGSSDVELRNITGEMSVDTGSGGVRVTHIHGSRLAVDTGSGGVEGSDLEASTITIDTGSGEVDLSAVRAQDIRVDTGSGGVTLGLLSDVRSIDVDTGSGGVTLAIPPTLGAEIEVDCGSGGLDSDVPLQLVKRDGSYVRARIGDGQGRIVVDTGSGGVRLKSI